MGSAPFVCVSCARTLRLRAASRAGLTRCRRHLSRSLPVSGPTDHAPDSSGPARQRQDSSSDAHPEPPDVDPDSVRGAMTSRLQQATEDALLTGGRAGKRAIEEAGFSEELKAKLLDKVATANFHAEHSAALAEAGITSRIPDSAGLGTRAVASAQPWTGEESTEDAVLRMLNDAHKPLPPGSRGQYKPPVPAPVDMRLRREPRLSPGHRVSSARDKAHTYAGMGMKDKGLSEEEREAVKREFRERFAPGARAMPNTISGLSALANERIEDAIARGQFKNIPRGPGVERDTRADNPFIDTTEYIMNKMIKRQEIVPPWIEKQQELIRAAETFRARLRNDWKRHAARMIASRGGTLEQQVARADAYARAEELHNPRRRNPEQISVPTNSTDDVVMLQITSSPASSNSTTTTAATTTTTTTTSSAPTNPSAPTPTPADGADVDPSISQPFRDPAWEAAERSYMSLAVSHLNALTRSYNLMAPELAKKPYFSLERELRSCFADVAPQVAGEIRLRATAPARSLVDDHPFGGGRGRGRWRLRVGAGLDGGGHGSAGGGSAGVDTNGGGVLRALLGGGADTGAKAVAESPEKHYGWKEFWRDLWSKEAK